MHGTGWHPCIELPELWAHAELSSDSHIRTQASVLHFIYWLVAGHSNDEEPRRDPGLLPSAQRQADAGGWHESHIYSLTLHFRTHLSHCVFMAHADMWNGCVDHPARLVPHWRDHRDLSPFPVTLLANEEARAPCSPFIVT
jgi:hypothetical protein